MFLRKLTVLTAPLLLLALCAGLLLLLPATALMVPVKGILAGAALALLLPLSGATRQRESFAGLLWLPFALLSVLLVLQGLALSGRLWLNALSFLYTADPQLLALEGAFDGFMLATLIRFRL